MTQIKPGQFDNLAFSVCWLRYLPFPFKYSLKPGIKKEGHICFAFQLDSELLKHEGRVFPTESLFQKGNTLKDKEVFPLLGT